MKDSIKIITQLNLEPHPEGGYFRETYRSHGEINKVNLGQDFNVLHMHLLFTYFR